MISLPLLLTTALTVASGTEGFAPPARSTTTVALGATDLSRRARQKKSDRDDSDPNPCDASAVSRPRFLAAAATALLPALASRPAPSAALVKGNAPPPKRTAADGAGGGGGDAAAPKCRNVEECQEQAYAAEEARARREAERAAAGPQPQLAAGGTRYLDVAAGDPERGVARAGTPVEVHYRVLKLGKRSYDGLSGEGTVVFSRGYGLEDDETAPGDRSFRFTPGDDANLVIRALNDAVPGMAAGGVRRISVPPQRGWERHTRACDGGPGGELKTDYVVVPTATVVEQEACFDKERRPFPTTYAQERRMAQRFDQSLIVEVRLVRVG